jgi:hypothetical protein
VVPLLPSMDCQLMLRAMPVQRVAPTMAKNWEILC